MTARRLLTHAAYKRTSDINDEDANLAEKKRRLEGRTDLSPTLV